MPTLLLTGFEPFLSFPINPTKQIVHHLHGRQIGGYHIEGRILPVDYDTSGAEILSHIEETQPDVVLSLGLAAGRQSITPERIAINWNESSEKDNRGNKPDGEPIHEEGADGLFTTLPIRQFVEGLHENGYPAQISNTAGTYVCNHVMYQTLYHFKKRKEHVPSGFIHLPASHELAVQHGKLPSWPQQDLTAAIECVIESIDS
ncbi:pyroglutamyl-peptidase I [Halobacillus kuroshimensis]|uniref:Pyrrolidone-carboxylate peptidase n=1 Tax=Halobacillus kuroshimensis TaxID=302481 RepID=A0ABS3DV38_9BACI|nr:MULTISPECIES: pyroglutamyl-peptidase I [Halobacillus]MBN8235181.1 pyroglutamyl-peptidase I [Halobacillus kuroshimensis]